MTDRGIMDIQHGYAMQGYFVTAEKRQRDAWESKGTHFSMGNHPRINNS